MSTERDPLYILGYQKGFASAAIKGQQAERERIVALLESKSDLWRDSDYDAHHGAERCIALIRGDENV